jgi:Na+/H+ antiporter NhaD/arsenite permease-like protein
MSLVPMIILVVTFLGLLIGIAKDVMERSILALIAGLITYIVLIFMENAPPIIFVEYIIGTSDEGYTNFHSIVLLFSMMLLVQIANEGGLFQYMSFRLIQLTKGRPYLLMAVLCVLGTILSSIITDMLTVILLIPLTINVCRTLDLNPIPYVITQGILFKMGGTIFMISSIPAILVSNELHLSFTEFFINGGLVSLGVALFSVFFFLMVYRKKLPAPRQGIDILLEFNVSSFVRSQSLLYKSMWVLGGVMVSFVVIPKSLLPPDAIAFIGAVVLAAISKIDLTEIMDKLDTKLLIYLMGIFALSGGLEYTGFINLLGTLVGGLSSSNPAAVFVSVLWISAIFSSVVDNIPVAKIMIPVVEVLTSNLSPAQAQRSFFGLTYGVTWGDNLSPFGDTVLLFNVAKKNHIDLSPGAFFRLGFITTILQMTLLSLFFTLLYDPITGFIIIAILSVIGVVLYFVYLYKVKGIKAKYWHIDEKESEQIFNKKK